MKNAFDIGDARVRVLWSATVPAILVLLYTIHAIKLPTFIKRVTNYLKAPFRQFISLKEAEALDSEDPIDKEEAYAPLWSTLGLSWIALLEASGWMGIATFKLITIFEDQEGSERHEVWQIARATLMVYVWLYASIKPMVKRKPTPQYDLFCLYLVLLSSAVFVLGGDLYDRSVHRMFVSRLSIAAQSVNLAALVGLLVIMLSMPVAVPSKRVDPVQIGKSVTPEDYTTLWGWATFSWVQPLIDRGTYKKLDEDDVWEMSPLLKTKPVFRKYTSFQQKSLFWHLVAANSLDLIIEFVFTVVSVFLNYSGPLFLKLIIDAIDHPNPGRKAQAYIYAFLALVARFLMAESDLQHLYFGRRACTRLRAELMTAIYAKALKRRDFSGVANLKKGGDGEEDSGKKKGEKEGKDEAGADLGKIVNLMSGDVNSISNVLQGMPYLYQAPVEIAIACAFLYQLLGWAAFVGFLPIFVSWPINSLLSGRFVRLRRLFTAARDKRMSIMNELIGSVKFIKFFAWEGRWIQRALDQRNVELRVIVQNQITILLFLTTAALGPVLVSVVAFFVYVSQGKELTVGIAFTAIQLFTMIRTPLNVLPSFLVQMVQVRVCFQRIQSFLDEEEVDDQVSTIKRNESGPTSPSRSSKHEIGLRNATLQWNKPKDEKPDGDKGKVTVMKTLSASDHEVQETASMAPTESSEYRQRFELSDISVVFPEGMFTVVTGPTASGKTALLLSLLGEMTLLSGEILLNKDTRTIDENGLTYGVSYAAQTPWLQQQSIKDNIIFGYPFDETRYKQVLECCALNPDLKVLEDGDMTEIGARGVSLSGGQKARVALARAVYARTKYVLLDDPLSAVDSHTARFLYERLFLGPLMKNRTVILVTHHIELVLPGTYYLVRMLDGRIDKQGTVKDLRAEGVLDEITLEAKVEAAEQEKEETEQEEIVVEGSLQSQEVKVARKLVEEEERAEGGIKWSIYKVYLEASSYWTWITLFVLMGFTQGLGVGEKWWIMKWGEAYGDVQEAILSLRHHSANAKIVDNQVPFTSAFAQQFHSHSYEFARLPLSPDLPSAQDQPMFYVVVYALIGLLSILLTALSHAVLVIGVLRASRILFKRLLLSVVHATMRWHDTTPTGRILNRFSKDIETIDGDLGSSLQNVNTSLAAFAASTLVIVIVFPAFAIPASILGYLYYNLAIGYLNTGRDLRRMESNARSPLFSGFSDLLEGIVTVRAFSADPVFLQGFYEKVDLLQKMWYAFWMTNRYLLVRFDCLGAIAVFVTSLFALSGLVSAGLAGLCITSAMAFSMNIYWACRFWTTLELDLNSVERVVEYLNLPQEPPSIIENSRPPAHWPSSTGPNVDSLIDVEDLEVKYAPDLPAVLHGISFKLKAGERVGLLGRTGSGKSTLAMSLLRFADPTKGRILIDGIDITTIGVEDLRSRLTFIPQDASLFSGKLRDNLDPFGDYSDIECLDALHRVHMISNRARLSQRSSRETSRAPSIRGVEQHDTVSTIVAPSSSNVSQSPTVIGGEESGEGPENINLNTEVSAGGLNFSAGQRQLIAMARALLRHSAIVIFDEATSSIDFATDAKIQETIRDEFTGSLLLTIAHRLRTVIDYDRLIVLDSGNIAELDTPWNLIQKENGIFRQMCLKSGSFAELEAIAFAKSKAKGQDHE